MRLQALLVLFALALPAQATELPSFCTQPTPQERADLALQEQCKILTQLEKSMDALRQKMKEHDEQLRKGNATLDQRNEMFDKTIESMEEFGKKLDEFTKQLPPPIEHPPEERIPSRPGQR